MPKSKIVAMMALIAFAMGIFLVGDAVGGEKGKGRTVRHNVKWEQINVGDEDGHVIAVAEYKGILTNLEGKLFADGCVERCTGLYDMNLKTGFGSTHGFYGETTDKDGNKFYWTAEARLVKGSGFWEGTWRIVKGTGKFEGIQGKGTARSYSPAKGQVYIDWEVEVELPR